MRANKGYRLDAVLVDGKPVDTERTYRFAPVTKNHTISARFVPLDTPVSPMIPVCRTISTPKTTMPMFPAIPETGLVRMIS